jgi:hypothetical protein
MKKMKWFQQYLLRFILNGKRIEWMCGLCWWKNGRGGNGGGEIIKILSDTRRLFLG